MDSVRIVLYNETQPWHFFALSEADDPTTIKLPGGKFEQTEAGEVETPDQAAARELMQELGLTPAQIGLIPVGELVNDDGVSKRYIYAGSAHPDLLQPSEEVYEVRELTEASIPEGKNRNHMLAALALSNTVWGNRLSS